MKRFIYSLTLVITTLTSHAQLAGWTAKGGLMHCAQNTEMFGADGFGTRTSFSAYAAREMYFGYANSFSLELGYRNKNLSLPDSSNLEILRYADFSTLSIGLNWKFWIGNFLAVNRMQSAKCADKDNMIYNVTFKPWLAFGISRDFILGYDKMQEALWNPHKKGGWDFYGGIGFNLFEFPDNYDPVIVFLELRYFQELGKPFELAPYEKLRNNGIEIMLGLKFSKDAKYSFQGWG